jgi:hypothetical protein
VAGEATEADIAALDAWDASQRPAWLDAPFGMSMDTAAALSQVGLPPNKWGAVDLIPRGNFEPWTMVVTPKAHMGTTAYDITVNIPGGPLADETLDFLMDNDIEFVVHGTP